MEPVTFTLSDASTVAPPTFRILGSDPTENSFMTLTVAVRIFQASGPFLVASYAIGVNSSSTAQPSAPTFRATLPLNSRLFGVSASVGV